MTTVPPADAADTSMRILDFPGEDTDAPEQPTRWSKFTPGESQLRAAAFGTLVGLLIAVVLGAAYGAQPGGSLWALNRTAFPTHSQDVAVRAVVSQLKNAQDILGNGKQPSSDQLSEARTSLNEAKRGLEFVSASDQRTSLQNLYMQLNQQLRQYTPEQAQQLPALPAPPGVNADANLAANASPVGAPSPPPSWGYAAAASGPAPAPQTYWAPPPPGIPVDPVADWPAPMAPPLTPNLGDLGGFDPSWMLLYGYNVVDWFNWGLSGFNRYGYDFMGFDRWGYDRWGYDRWGYDRWSYNWDGYNWGGYNRDGRDRDGRNEWGQYRDDDPRDQGWYDRHHPFRQYYEWKFQNTNPVFSRNLWDQSHGIDPAQYRDWNLNRNWDNPLERDWSPVARVADRPVLTEPVVNLDASLAQFLAEDKTARPSGDLIKELSTKSTRNFSKELAKQAPAPEKSPDSTTPVEEKVSAPPALTVTAPVAPPKEVPADFTPPSLPTVPPLTPAPSTEPRATTSTTGPAPSTTPSHSPTPTSEPAAPPKDATSVPTPAPSSAAPVPTPKDEPSTPVTTPAPVTPVTPATPHQTVTTPPVETSEPSVAPEPTKQRTTPTHEVPTYQTPTYEAPTYETPAPRATVEPAPQPTAEAPVKQAPVEREAPVTRERPTREQEAPTREAPTREAPTYSTPAQSPGSGRGSH
ncbi:hypothetical protein FZI91_19260 [Mycobacterium sp. CBMA271]|uniref:hypothetical protein n=1 Tax=unclassified Mycobacteroides TaxID=2618759 RepID=UPI0012DDE9D1|nr:MULTISPECIES: hypothetical protein [unclassified Mycobacteroides]MUM17153.1 hypothetical protein [Mycobacteroides sp. CBMA 326]MUM23822.1 hypothetical protein [Mycobacteroides sp. CBMA 271]